MRIVDVFLAFPVIVLGLGISDACSGQRLLQASAAPSLIRPGLGTVMFIIALSSFTYIARIVRGQVLSIREKEFVEASRSLGASNFRILTREILPNLMTPLIVYSSLLIPTNILLEAALSFLGVGIQPPTPSLGQMISAGGLRPARRQPRLVADGLPRRRAAAARAGMEPARRRFVGRAQLIRTGETVERL